MAGGGELKPLYGLWEMVSSGLSVEKMLSARVFDFVGK